MTKYDEPEAIEDRFARLKAAVLFMKMSDDKFDTIFRLAISQKDNFDYLIWVAPASFIRRRDYRLQIRKYARGLLRRTYFFSIEGISSSDISFLRMHNIVEAFRIFCVVDESLTIKNAEADRTRRLLEMSGNFHFRLIVSGIPIVQGLIDFYSQLQFLDKKILEMSEMQFMHRFLPFYEDDYKVFRRWSTPENEMELVRLMNPYILASDLDRDGKISYFNHYFDLNKKEAKAYMDEKKFLLNRKEKITFLEVIQKFQHIYTLAHVKVEALLVLLTELVVNKQEKVVVYVKFMDEIIWLKECGCLKGFKFVEMVGGVGREKALKIFNKDADIMFCTYGSGGMGLDLSCCNNIIYFSQTFDYKDKMQGVYSLYQRVESKHIKVYNFWVRTGLENLMFDSVCRKGVVLKNVCKMIDKRNLMKL